MAVLSYNSPNGRLATDSSDIEMLRSLLRYDRETGKLYWLHRPNNFYKKKWAADRFNKFKAGKEAFISKCGSGYLSAEVGGKNFMAHRVIWAIVHGCWPAAMIDHIDGDQQNNRLENLRCATGAQNAINRRIHSNNSSGAIGVCYHAQSTRWYARISHNGKRIELGLFDSFEDAVSARRAAEVEYGYSKFHGAKDRPVYRSC